MTTVVLLAVIALLIWRARRHTARLRRSAARVEVLSEREAAERLRPHGGVEAAPIEAPIVKTNGWRSS